MVVSGEGRDGTSFMFACVCVCVPVKEERGGTEERDGKKEGRSERDGKDSPQVSLPWQETPCSLAEE